MFSSSQMNLGVLLLFVLFVFICFRIKVYVLKHAHDSLNLKHDIFEMTQRYLTTYHEHVC